jgi:hypothetical protein
MILVVIISHSDTRRFFCKLGDVSAEVQKIAEKTTRQVKITEKFKYNVK